MAVPPSLQPKGQNLASGDWENKGLGRQGVLPKGGGFGPNGLVGLRKLIGATLRAMDGPSNLILDLKTKLWWAGLCDSTSSNMGCLRPSVETISLALLFKVVRAKML